MRGSLSSPSYLVRNPTLAPQLGKTHRHREIGASPRPEQTSSCSSSGLCPSRGWGERNWPLREAPRWPGPFRKTGIPPAAACGASCRPTSRGPAFFLLLLPPPAAAAPRGVAQPAGFEEKDLCEKTQDEFVLEGRPSIRVFSNESTLHMRWTKYWSFSFNISQIGRAHV